MPDITSALPVIRPNSEWILDGEEYSGLTWLPTNTQLKPTEEEINAETAWQRTDTQICIGHWPGRCHHYWFDSFMDCGFHSHCF